MVALLSSNSFNQSEDSGRTGALTDGLKWSFYHNEDTVWYNTILWTRDDAAALRVLRIAFIIPLISGVLVFLVAGKFPTTNRDAALWFKE